MHFSSPHRSSNRIRVPDSQRCADPRWHRSVVKTPSAVDPVRRGAVEGSGGGGEPAEPGDPGALIGRERLEEGGRPRPGGRTGDAAYAERAEMGTGEGERGKERKMLLTTSTSAAGTATATTASGFLTGSPGRGRIDYGMCLCQRGNLYRTGWCFCTFCQSSNPSSVCQSVHIFDSKLMAHFGTEVSGLTIQAG